MRLSISAGAFCLALAAYPATAAPITFSYTGAIVDYAVPVTGQYTITAVGARGGNVPDNGGAGGLGAEASGTFSLAQGELLRILVGAAGADNAISPQGPTSYASGGGGSFVVGTNSRPLVVAGGGGGGGQLYAAFPPDFQPVRGGSRYNGGDALTGPGGGTVAAPGSAGGTAGGDGQGGAFVGAGRSAVNGGRGFNAFPSGLGAGAFGGGGHADGAGAGGGGGYSGGGGGSVAGNFTRFSIASDGGGGGGSFTAGADPVLRARVGTGDGTVTITSPEMPIPEPASLAVLGLGLLGLATFGHLRRR